MRPLIPAERRCTVAFEDDKKTLVAILEFIERVLEELITEHIREDRELFELAWFREVKPRLQELTRSVYEIPGEDSPAWHRFQDRGLTSAQLQLKRTRLAAASRKGIRKKLLDLINTILGSIPGADPIKELKEFGEEALDEGNASFRARFI